MTPHTIFVHCTATRPDWWADETGAAKVAEIRRWHVKERGWSDIGYHKLIDRDGTVHAGRPETRQGAHAKGHNRNTLAVALFGGHGSSETDAFSDNFTGAQDRALRKVIADWEAEHPSILAVRGHNEVAAKSCPGFNVRGFMQAVPVVKATKPSIASMLSAFFGSWFK